MTKNGYQVIELDSGYNGWQAAGKEIYRNGKKILILDGKAQPKIIRKDKLNDLIIK